MTSEVRQRKHNGKQFNRTVTTVADKIATHDSRRIYATIMEEAGTAPKLIKMGLDHLPDDAEGYGGKSWSKLRDAEDKAFRKFDYI